MGEAIITRTLENSDVSVVQEKGQSTTNVMSQKAVTDELDLKVDKVEGKGLSSENFTAEDKEKLGIAVPQTRTINSKSLSEDVVLTAEDVGALPGTTIIPSKTSELENDSGFLTGFIETDPTVPTWAKASSKPTYTASEVGAVPTTRTVNGKALSSNITLSASDVEAASLNHTHAAGDITSDTLPVSRGGTGAATASSARTNLSVYSKSEVDNKLTASSLGKLLYPVGSICLSANRTNPQSVFGGTWVSWGSGRVPIGVKTSDEYFSTVEKTGGSKSHAHILSDAGAAMIGSDQDAAYTIAYAATNVGDKTGTIYAAMATGTTPKAKRAHNTALTGWTDSTTTLPPYITCYMWKRTA